MGVLPLQFKDGLGRENLGLDGTEIIDLTGLEKGILPRMDLMCKITYFTEINIYIVIT